MLGCGPAEPPELSKERSANDWPHLYLIAAASKPVPASPGAAMESLTQPTDGPTRTESPGLSEIEELELSDLLSPPALDWAGASEKARRWWGRNMRMMRLRRIPSAQRVYQKAKAAKRACRRAASALSGQSESGKLVSG